MCARGRGWRALLNRRRRVGTLDFLLPRTSLLRRYPLFALRWRGRSLHALLLIVLPHDGVSRLVTVIPADKRWLLLHPGIPVP